MPDPLVPKKERQRRAIRFWLDIFKFLCVILLLIWFVARGTQELGYNWQWYRMTRYLYTIEDGRILLGPLFDGLLVTLRITGISLFLATLFGLTGTFLRLSPSFLGRAVARVYLEVIRNTPLLVQLFFIYFVLAPIFEMERFTAAVLSLSLFEGAYASEIFRAGILSIHAGQKEAAQSLGMGTFAVYRHVILPQAIRRILPPLTSQAVSLIKDSALVSTIAIYDLTMQGQAIIAQTYLTFEIWLTVAAIYLVVTSSLSLTIYAMEKRLKTAQR